MTGALEGRGGIGKGSGRGPLRAGSSPRGFALHAMPVVVQSAAFLITETQGGLMDRSNANDMHGSLWPIPESERRERGPVATGTITVSGVPLRIALWPKKVVDNPGSKANGKHYMPVSVEYPRGSARFLAPFSPSDVTVASATAPADGASRTDAASTADMDEEDLPF